MVLVYGFAGLRDFDGKITFRPRLPAGVTRLRFPLTIRGNLLDVSIEDGTTTYTLLEGEGLTIGHFDEEVSLTRGVPETLPAHRRLDRRPACVCADARFMGLACGVRTAKEVAVETTGSIWFSGACGRRTESRKDRWDLLRAG